MHLQLFVRFVLLAVGFALTTYGVLGWHQLGFNIALTANTPPSMPVHPVYMLILGLALIPPSLWEIFVFQTRIDEDTPSEVDRDDSPRA